MRDEIYRARIAKLEALKGAGFSPYPISSKRTHTVAELLENFSSLEKGGKEATLVGRIRTMRQHGGITFCHVQDETGQFQTAVRKDAVGEKSYEFFLEHFDIGDFVQMRGTVFSTKRGEKTLDTADYLMLAKSLLPLPEKWHGIQDTEERFRKRYLDLLFREDVRKKFLIRSSVLKALRVFMEREGFMEVETPALQPVYGGAAARPFVTNFHALGNMEMFLRISPELYLKRLLVGGFEKVYEMGRVFRNEGIDRSHNPEFTSLEFYWAYQDYKALMKLTERMISFVVKEALGKEKVSYEGKEIDFTPPFPRVEFDQVLRKYAGVDYDSMNEETLAKKAEEMGISLEKNATKVEIADEIFKKSCLPHFHNPVFLIHHPVGTFSLAKTLPDNEKRLASFQLFAGGFQLTTAFSELNDPLEQEKRLREQETLFKKGLNVAQRFDEDFVEALSYGMPPASGFGMGVDRLCALCTDSHSLREIILFPAMKKR